MSHPSHRREIFQSKFVKTDFPYIFNRNWALEFQNCYTFLLWYTVIDFLQQLFGRTISTCLKAAEVMFINSIICFYSVLRLIFQFILFQAFAFWASGFAAGVTAQTITCGWTLAIKGRRIFCQIVCANLLPAFRYSVLKKIFWLEILFQINCGQSHWNFNWNSNLSSN